MPGHFSGTFGLLDAVAVTPSDTADLPGGYGRGLYVGGGGVVVVDLMESEAPVTLVDLAPGIWHPLVVRRVRATGTTATAILAGR